jgi:TolB-like protein
MNLLTHLKVVEAECRRRKVFRAAAVYLATAFVILQVGDIVIEPLGLPHWSMPLLIALSAVGFVLAVVLAWIYQVTPEGVRRTAPRENIAGSGTDRRHYAATVAVVLVILGGGWAAKTSLVRAPFMDPEIHAVAVLPFRVAGAGDELAYMREGLVDLLSAILQDRADLPVVPPRVMLRELGDAGAGADARTRAAVRRTGARRMITGEVVGRAQHMTLTATLHDLRTGTRVAAAVSGPESELNVLVESLATQLVARNNPLTTDRIASLEGVPLMALRHYLQGIALQRRGRFAESMEPLRSAIAIDSTFALAALAFDIAASWAPADPDEAFRMQVLAWEHRDRLNPVGRLQLDAQVWTYPEILSPAVRLRRIERALESLPERHELWYEYGDLLVHEGQAVGIPGWREAARAAFQRALVLVPDDVEANYHLAELAYEAGDASAMEAAAQVLERDPGAVLHSGVVKGLRALLYNDSASWNALRALPAAELGSTLIGLRYYALTDGRGIDSLLAIARRLERSAITAAEREIPAQVQFWLLVNTGRPAEALEAYARSTQRQGAAGRLERLQIEAWVGAAWDGDSKAGRRAVEELRTAIEMQASREGQEPPHPFYICTVAVLDLLNGRTDWAARAQPWLDRGAQQLATTLDRAQARSCPVIIAAAAAHAAGAPADAQARLTELEEFLTESPFGAKRLRSIGNLVAALLHEHYGDPAAALIAWRRLQDTMAQNFLTTALREEARLLALLDRHDEADRVVRRYLALRTYAEPRLYESDERTRQRATASDR